jgi:hypothetical protein
MNAAVTKSYPVFHAGNIIDIGSKESSKETMIYMIPDVEDGNSSFAASLPGDAAAVPRLRDGAIAIMPKNRPGGLIILL